MNLEFDARYDEFRKQAGQPPKTDGAIDPF